MGIIMGKKISIKLRYLRVKTDAAKKTVAKCSEELAELINCWRLHGIENINCDSVVKKLTICAQEAVIIT